MGGRINSFPLTFQGGLRTAVDPAYLDDGECPIFLNAIASDGTVRLDQRYALFCDAPNVTQNVAGAGYGKYTVAEQYVVANAGLLYKIDLTAATKSQVALTGGSYTPDGRDWFFQQFGQYIYGVNSTYGFGRTLIGSNSWTKLTNPAAPVAAPTIATNGNLTPTFTSAVLDLTGTTLGGSPAGTDVFTAGGGWARTYGVSQVGNVSFDITFAAPLDFSYVDMIRIAMTAPITVNWALASVRLIIGGVYSADGVVQNFSNINGTLYLDIRLSNISRTSKLLTQGFSITLTPDRTIPSASVIRIGYPTIYGTWLTIDSSSNPGTDPTFAPLVYRYTYYNSTTGLESLASPAATLAAASQNKYGQWENVTVVASAESGVDKIRIYRVVTNASDGSTTLYRLAEVNNANQTYVDKLPLDEVEFLPTFSPFQIPTSGYTAICAWQDRIVVAANGIIYVSREGDALSFTPLGTVADPTDAARARTFYADDSRSEVVLGLASQDALYMVMDKSVRAIYGSSVDDWRLTKLPEAEGSYGTRSWFPYRGGVLVHTPSYRLQYVNVGEGVPEEVSKKLRVRIGSLGLGASRLVGVRPNGEIEVRRHNDSGPRTHSYGVLDVEGRWRSGTHFHESSVLLFIPSLPIRWVGVDGKVYEGGDDSFTDDAGQPVTWTVRTKSFLLPRLKVSQLYIGESTQVIDPVNTDMALYPKFTIGDETNSGTEYVPKHGHDTIVCTHQAKGSTLWFEVTGDKDTILKRLEYRVDGVLSSAAQRKA